MAVRYRLGSRDGPEVEPAIPYATPELGETALDAAYLQWMRTGAWTAKHVRVLLSHGAPCLVAWYTDRCRPVLCIGRAVVGWTGEVIGQFP